MGPVHVDEGEGSLGKSYYNLTLMHSAIGY